MQQLDTDNIKTIREALLWASRFLQNAGSQDSPFEAELLLRHVLGWSRSTFLANLPDPISKEAVQRLKLLCERRATREPLQYILGKQEFFGRDFVVKPGVLIPRPETEILIEQVLQSADQLWPARQSLDVADIGTGSGAICLTLACERPDWQVTTVELSAEAIEIARQNARELGVGERVVFLQGDLAGPLVAAGRRLDILVSNPPYIPSADVQGLDREVRDYEPLLALDGGDDGLDCYRRICAALPALLKPVALVAFEVGIDQARSVAKLMRSGGEIDEVKIVPDLAGISRVVLGCRRRIANLL
ncbi:peptide chain release factor N(5)-glutamine methyltransferase [Brevibacillus massiliensis]|jgi:release factor glutamine methyltransferase|uniref:peptide chain release factor N(5)-glutamine methyltransferase n=1 Tax=Brevibacillus massiliensis TaxID=1118054 RepID=UPI000307B598|nr:peptide chain release factor N(5)-glutamine methyltransferase [Brevibacillus massiliensis]